MKNIYIYRPNKSVKGFACSFWVSDKSGCLFATLIKQSGWDEKTQHGTFKASKNDPLRQVNIKLSGVEACGILDCIERGRPFQTYHDFGELRAISFVPWMFTPATEEGQPKAAPAQKGYSFSVTNNPKDANKNSFYIGMTFAEGRYLREFLIHFLHWSFDKDYESAEPIPRTTPEPVAEPAAEAVAEPEQINPPEESSNVPVDVLADF